MGGLFQELRRRNIFRVAGVYAVAGWILAQVSATLENALNMPPWFDTMVVSLLLIGFPIAMILAWAFEMTPTGVKRTEGVSEGESIAPKTGRKLDYVIIAGLTLVAALVVWQGLRNPSFEARPDGLTPQDEVGKIADNIVPHPEARAQRASKDANPNPTVPALDKSKSIAVLPFADFSSAQDQEWFADGLTEEILNALARTPDLLVTSRTSSFKFKNTEEEIPAIARKLGVAHVLEGSVRRGGDRLRVTAQLIRAADGFHLWSENYDSTSNDVIAIQEDMAVNIATALKTVMDPVALAKMTRAGTRSVPAYEAYLQGLALAGGDLTFKDSYDAFEQARTLDPGFADAHFRASNYWASNLSPSGTDAQNIDEVDKNTREYMARIDAAIRASDGQAQQLRYRADKVRLQFRLAEAVQYLERYLQTAPLDFEAWSDLSDTNAWLARYDAARIANSEAEKLAGDNTFRALSVIFNYIWARDFQAAAKASRRALSLDPDNLNLLYQAHRALLWAGETDEARALTARLYEGQMRASGKLLVRVRQACADGDRANAETFAEEIYQLGDDEAGPKWLAHQLLGDKEGAVKELARFDRVSPPILLGAWLYYPYFDPEPYPNFRDILARENIVRPPVEAIPFACPAEENGNE